MTLENALKLLELNSKNVVGTIFQCKVTPETKNVCKANFYSEDSKQQAPELPLDKAKIQQYHLLIEYWLGQLQFVQQQAKTVSPAMGIINYQGKPWTEDNRALFALYYLATSLRLIPKFRDRELPGIDKFYDRLPATYAPSDPRFRITTPVEAVLFSLCCFDTQKETIAAAKRGDAAAQCRLASMLHSWAPSEYKEQAKGWYELAAKQGNTDAMLNLGLYFEKKEMIMKAAELGNAEAQYEIGRAYNNKKDMSRAIYWYEKAAEQNHDQAVYVLWGTYYGSEDRATYAKWTAKLCELNNSDRIYTGELGLLANEANELSRNGSYTLGYQIMRPIAEYAYKTQNKKFAQSCALIGADYVNGYGVAKDRNEGIKWLKRALDLGFELAREILDEIGAP